MTLHRQARANADRGNGDRRRRSIAAAALVAALLGVGCGSETQTRCTRDPECPAGSRCADGTCTPLLRLDTGRTDVSRRLDGALPDRRLPWPDGTTDRGASCQGNKDGKIDRSEMLFLVGTKVPYTVGTGLTVNLKGTSTGGKTEWDLTANAADDHKVVSELLAVPAWAASSFAGASYVGLLDESLGTYGVFKAAPGALQLLGVIAQEKDKTKLSYATPVDMWRFPIVAPDSYTSEAGVSGLMDWIYLWLNESYAVDVLAAGAVKLPQLTLDVALLRVKVKQYPIANPFLVTTRVSYFFIAECYGVVGKVDADGDPGDKLEAVKAKERRRLTF